MERMLAAKTARFDETLSQAMPGLQCVTEESLAAAGAQQGPVFLLTVLGYCSNANHHLAKRSRKKKSKFKSFKKFFGKKKRKETSSSVSSTLKLCQSTSDVAAPHDMRISYDSEDELETHKGIMGSRALSHDSIFILETGQEPARPVRVFSQENISDRIRALQFSDSHKHLSSLSLAGTGSEEEEQVTLGSSSRSCSTDGQPFTRHGSTKTGSPRTSDSTISPTANFDTPPELSAFLDNSAAKHKLLIKPRNQRSSRMRKFSQRIQSESLTDLSCTPEEEEEDDAVFKPSSQELPCSTAATQNVASWPKPRMPEDLPPALRPVMTQPASESAVGQENLLPENKQKDCQPTLEMTSKVSSRNEKWQDDFQKGSDLDMQKSSNEKETLLPESYSENTGHPTEILAGYVSPDGDAAPMPSNSSVASQNQPSCKDKGPFQVKLRSISLSLKYEDNSPSESKGIKRYSAEFDLENEGLTSFLRGDKAEIRKTANTNTGDSLNEKIKPKSKSSEQLSSKPPLPKKPVLQSITIPNTTASKEKQDKAIHSPESRNEDRDLEKQSTACKVPEKNVLSPVAAGDFGRDPDTPTEPAWISIARQKQRGMHQEKEVDREKLVAPDKSNTEKQNKGKEKPEGPVKQQWSKPSHLAPKTTSEEQKKDTKSEAKSLLRTNSLSHYVPAAPSPALVDKEEISHLKKASSAAPDQPSWMELAKKKSQAWSDMPQIIK
ncbi:hypothetical protein DUI87_16110 [Hirundo rustica rustica]|uniref:DUF4592 domain-containing protein n=1 Tax=Hirundo rustica rustica TaxID=333673 RepID=A0A3M0K2P6_HIRRU|nr:hypothetical protein DUI87_16110 [Hirundo rustica rustica]